MLFLRFFSILFNRRFGKTAQKQTWFDRRRVEISGNGHADCCHAEVVIFVFAVVFFTLTLFGRHDWSQESSTTTFLGRFV